VKSALTELAEEFNKRANQMERAERVKALRRVQDGSLYRPRRSAYRI
jgi:mRNA-degrading endonuclease RelE of RelBE toxin-antitoxin system